MTFMPPAVDPEAPPINMRPVKKKLVCCLVSAKSIVENPAVRPLTDWTKESIN